jgi:uncharacterized membrane protein YraQ (UPF0718 family)
MDIFYPIQYITDAFTNSLLGLKGELAASLNYFIYDSIKILLLLLTIIFVVSYLRSYVPPDKVRKILHSKFGIFGNVLAALFGTITPFCTCSAIPLFIGFLESGVPLGVTFSYLISAPMVNEIAAILLLGLFGWKIALLYVISGVIIATVMGFILGKMHLEKYVESYVWKKKIKLYNVGKIKWRERAGNAWEQAINITRNVFPYVLAGVAIGALIHGYAPADFLAKIAGKGNIFAVPIAVLIGVPLYSSAAGTIPVVISLIEKGLPLGTALAFMMAVTALSFPEFIILRKILKPRLLFLYFGIVALGIMFTGYLFNLVL